MKQIGLISIILLNILILVNCTSSLILPNTKTSNISNMNFTPIVSTTIPLSTTENYTITPTIISTISSRETMENIRKVYLYNNKCKFPCFWGIVPGHDSIQSVIDRFSPYAIFEDRTEANDTMKYFVMILYPPSDIDNYSENEWEITMGVQDGIIKTLAASGAYTSLFANQDLSLFLHDLNNPQEIWLITYPGMGIEPWYSLMLYYPKKSTIISWRGSIKKIEEMENKRIYTICPSNFVNDIDMVLYIPPYFFSWSPNEDIPFSEINKNYLADEPFVLLSKENSTLDIINFYDKYINSDVENCFLFTN